MTMAARRRKLVPPAGVRVIIVCPDPATPVRTIECQMDIDAGEGWSAEFERKYARQIYRGVEQLNLL